MHKRSSQARNHARFHLTLLTANPRTLLDDVPCALCRSRFAPTLPLSTPASISFDEPPRTLDNVPHHSLALRLSVHVFVPLGEEGGGQAGVGGVVLEDGR